MPLFDNPLFISLVMVAFGIAVKYVPALEGWPNRLIWIFNQIIGILARLAAPNSAHAGVFNDISSSLGWLIVPLEGIMARQIYEWAIRPTLEYFGIAGQPTSAAPVPKRQRRTAR